MSSDAFSSLLRSTVHELRKCLWLSGNWDEIKNFHDRVPGWQVRRPDGRSHRTALQMTQGATAYPSLSW